MSGRLLVMNVRAGSTLACAFCPLSALKSCARYLAGSQSRRDDAEPAAATEQKPAA